MACRRVSFGLNKKLYIETRLQTPQIKTLHILTISQVLLRGLQIWQQFLGPELDAPLSRQQSLLPDPWPHPCITCCAPCTAHPALEVLDHEPANSDPTLQGEGPAGMGAPGCLRSTLGCSHTELPPPPTCAKAMGACRNQRSHRGQLW